MTIQNQTKQTLLAQNAIEATSLIDQTLGLLKYKAPTAMLIKTRWGIHTFFMKYPIDILVVDKNKKVAKLKENLQPNHFFLWSLRHNKVIELPSGTIKDSKTEIDDIVAIS